MFFRRKPKGPAKKYVAYLHKMAKYRLVMSRLTEEPGRQVLVYFFDQTRKEIYHMAAALNIFLKSPGEFASENDLICCSAFDLSNHQFPEIAKVISMEVHPLLSHTKLLEQKFTDSQMEIEFHLGFDEAALAVFSMERMTNLMERLGMSENEPIEHSMVSKSIENGLEKLEKKLGADHQDVRTSQEDWMMANPI